MKTVKLAAFGILIGCVNILLGTGGGLLAVPILKKEGLDQKQAQANALAVILPLTIVSMIIYAKKQYVNFFDNFWILPGAVLGALLGTYLFSKISAKVFSKIFAAFMLYAGARMLYSLWIS